jgi:TRAP-type C4-dicarboxylate transport system permease small subunit
METLRKADKILNLIRTAGLIAVVAAAVGICTTNIVLRYLIRGVEAMRPFPWGDEVMRMCAIWIAFLAAGLGVKGNSHISVQAIVEKYVPQKMIAPLDKAARVIVLAVLLFITVYGVVVTVSMKNSYLQNLPVSNAWFYSAIPVGTAYLFYDYLLILIFGRHPFAKDAVEVKEI